MYFFVNYLYWCLAKYIHAGLQNLVVSSASPPPLKNIKSMGGYFILHYTK